MAAAFIYDEWAHYQVLTLKTYDSYNSYVKEDSIGKKLLLYLNSTQIDWVHKEVQDSLNQNRTYIKRSAFARHLKDRAMELTEQDKYTIIPKTIFG